VTQVATAGHIHKATAPAVAAEALVVVRGGRRVLHGLDFTVEAGRVTGLLGPSGSGKTTLMRAVVGVQRRASGTVTVLGRPAGSAELRHRVGYATQAPSIYSDLTVRANVRYFATIHSAASDAADETVEAVDLAPHAEQFAGNLSGGERARLSLACALVGSPALLVLDEPTVGLDPVLRADLWQRFHDLADNGTTPIVSSHVMDEARRCDRLLLLRAGHLVADDTPAELRAATGTADLEEAFLRLILQGEGGVVMLSVPITLATTRRVLRQLRHDRQTVVLILALPAVELTLLRFVLNTAPDVFDRWAVPLLGVFPLITMFLVTNVAMLRKRTSGTLERLLTTPVHKLDLLLGYALAFTLAAVVQAIVTSTLADAALGLDSRGAPSLVVTIALADALLGMALGLFTSAFAQTEFQAVQFMPALVIPQLLLCGLVWPRDQMAAPLAALSRVLPMTYAIDALREVAANTRATGDLWRSLTVVAFAAAVALVLGASTLRRQTP
jgi:ABC-2 type transport system ATP-binding protein/ABC-2 type transport system permease protein